MKFSKLTTNGRVTIPAPLRKKYRLTPGRRVSFGIAIPLEEIAEDGIRIIPLATVEEVKTNAGFLGIKGKLLKSLVDEKKREGEL